MRFVMTKTMEITESENSHRYDMGADATLNRLKIFFESEEKERLEMICQQLSPPKVVVESWEERFKEIVDPLCIEFTNRWFQELYPIGEHSIPQKYPFQESFDSELTLKKLEDDCR